MEKAVRRQYDAVMVVCNVLAAHYIRAFCTAVEMLKMFHIGICVDMILDKLTLTKQSLVHVHSCQ